MAHSQSTENMAWHTPANIGQPWKVLWGDEEAHTGELQRFAPQHLRVSCLQFLICCHPERQAWSVIKLSSNPETMIKKIWRYMCNKICVWVYYNLDWYTYYCFLKGDIRRPWKIWSCQVDWRFEHGHTWATPRSCHGARKLATIRCVDFLHLWIFYEFLWYFFFLFATFFHIPLSLAFVSRSVLYHLSFPLHAGLCWSLYHRLHHLPVCYRKIQR